jgi:hypothetical protein
MKSIRLKIANVGLARWELKKISENKARHRSGQDGLIGA